MVEDQSRNEDRDAEGQEERGDECAEDVRLDGWCDRLENGTALLKVPKAQKACAELCQMRSGMNPMPRVSSDARQTRTTFGKSEQGGGGTRNPESLP